MFHFSTLFAGSFTHFYFYATKNLVGIAKCELLWEQNRAKGL